MLNYLGGLRINHKDPYKRGTGELELKKKTEVETGETVLHFWL